MNTRVLSLALAIVLTVVLALSSCGAQTASETTAVPTEKSTTEPASTATETKTEPKVKTTSEAPTKATEPDTQPETKKPTNKSDGKNVVIVLDAGHDSTTHTRNHPNLGVNEQDLNLKIAKTAYKRLKKYNGVTVYLSRPDGTCPIDRYNCPEVNNYPEPCIKARTDFADRKKANLFVSFHCNASTGNLGASAGGAEVYVTKYPKFYSKCKKLGKIILRNITASVDLASRGVLTRSKPEKGNYDDGTVKDFYYLLSNNVDNNRPAVIIEHAYMDNTHDNAILKDVKNLKRLGIADADAIAEYYGLELK